ncbi:hypothetical protein Q4Q35_01515 [Flavivirga aquimarina]|uniref:Uncharacterized protein n=1 Tax=Flavivirga aquimarina TaxID=2027862 RepID=A0ABT8W5T6_9FLAO|nr:hypothetical protein [Flavivirga aquimarina]MDO5968474.1 hypothetical protein [Flavivirga aquimarina]
MEKPVILASPDCLNIPNHYAIIATLFVLLDKSGLSKTVISHCKLGLRVVATCYDYPEGNSRTKPLSAKEFNAFFSFFPASFANSRDSIPVGTILDALLLCIKSNKITHVN